MQHPDQKPDTITAIAVYAFDGHTTVQQAAHPDHKYPLKTMTREVPMHRVGSAWLEADGSYIISLVSLPLNGQLYMKPPYPSFSHSETYKEE